MYCQILYTRVDNSKAGEYLKEGTLGVVTGQACIQCSGYDYTNARLPRYLGSYNTWKIKNKMEVGEPLWYKEHWARKVLVKQLELPLSFHLPTLA